MRALVLAALLAPACAPVMYVHKFGPERVQVQVDLEEYAGAHVWSSISVAGIRRPDPKSARGSQVEVRMRIENRSREAVALEPRTISLSSADLRSIGRAIVTPEPEPLAAGAAGEYLIVFPFPDGETPWEYDLRRVSLSWALRLGADVVRRRAEFVLRDPLHGSGLEQLFYSYRH